jgi:hypothetical protein
MKFVGILLAAVISVAGSAWATESHIVHSYVTKKGTFVPAHRQTNPNHTRRDNWSTKGNINPMTGKKGTKNPSPLDDAPAIEQQGSSN